MFDRRGVTLLELVVSLLVGGILMGIAVNAFGDLQAWSSVRSAESAFRTLHGQTRAFAVERGQRVVLVVDGGSSQVNIEARSDGEVITLATRNFLDEFNAEIRSEPALVELCMSSRGFGELGCNSFTSEARILFHRAGQEREVRLLPLGQLAEGA